MLLAVLLLAGCTAPPDSDETGAADAESVGAASLPPGGEVNLFLSLEGVTGPAEAEIIDDDGLDVEAPELHSGNGTVAGWVPVRAPDESGSHEIVLRITSSSAEPRDVSFEVTVEAPPQTAQAGEVAQTNLTLRTPDGELVMTTDAAVSGSPLPKTDDFQPPEPPGPAPLELSESAGIPAQLLEVLEGAGVGQQGTAAVPGLFGPETEQQREAREETLDRVTEVQRFLEAPREVGEQQGIVDNQSREGDAVELGGPFPYVIETLNETTLRVEADLDVGDTVTMHDAWPDASQVVAKAEETVEVRTDPPFEEGEPFTWRPEWPDATRIVATNDTEIVLRHSPEEGLEYTQQTQQGPIPVTVASVAEDEIVLETANPHPLAGVTLQMEFTVEAAQEPQPQPGAQQPGQPQHPPSG